MLIGPSWLQHHFEVQLSLAESPCSAVEETEMWGDPGPRVGADSRSPQSRGTQLPELCLPRRCLALPGRSCTKLRPRWFHRLGFSKVEGSLPESCCPWHFWMHCMLEACYLLHTSPGNSVKHVWSCLQRRLSSHSILYYTLLALAEEEGGQENDPQMMPGPTDNAWRDYGYRD